MEDQHHLVRAQCGERFTDDDEENLEHFCCRNFGYALFREEYSILYWQIYVVIKETYASHGMDERVEQ